MENHTRLSAAYTSLLGLSIGDAFGETFFGEEDEILQRLRQQRVPPGIWEFTDDTVMGIAVYKQLTKNGVINQDELAAEFARNYQLDRNRGYGGTAHAILRRIARGESWQAVSREVFDGMGSMGNGAAMRAGPIGAYFGADMAATITQARRSAEVTHANEEGICGAIAVAVAAGFASVHQDRTPAADYFDFVLRHLPASDTKAKIAKAATLSPACDIRTATTILATAPGSPPRTRCLSPSGALCTSGQITRPRCGGPSTASATATPSAPSWAASSACPRPPRCRRSGYGRWKGWRSRCFCKLFRAVLPENS